MSDFTMSLCSIEEAMEILGITADQLKIAKALDREKICELRSTLEDTITELGSLTDRHLFHKIIAWLPTFEDENK